MNTVERIELMKYLFEKCISGLVSEDYKNGYKEALQHCIDNIKQGTEGLSANEYQKLAMRTANEKCYNLANAGLGLSGEAGEATDIIKKYLFHGHGLENEHLAKELGDVMWYVALVATIIGYNLEDIMQMNIDKLKARYPEGFSEYDSQHRKAGDI